MITAVEGVAPPVAAATPRWRQPLVPLATAAGRIVVGLVAAHITLTGFPSAVEHAGRGIVAPGTWTGAFERWDARYYLSIAAHGYPPGRSDIVAFFPGYPMVVAALRAATGGLLAVDVSATIVSWVAFASAAVLLHRLAVRHLDPRVAALAVVLFCWFPTSCFYLAPYSEPLFALLVLGSVSWLDRGRLGAAALVAAYASATSPESVALTVTIVVAGLVARRRVWQVAAAAAAGEAGLLAYMAFLGFHSGDPLAFVHVQRDWHRIVEVPFEPVVRNLDAIARVLALRWPRPPGTIAVPVNVAATWILDDVAVVAAVVAVAVLVRRWRRSAGGLPGAVPLSWAVLAAAFVLTVAPVAATFATGLVSTEGDARLLSVAFPLYVAIAAPLVPGTKGVLPTATWTVGRRVAVAAVLGVCVAGAVGFQALFNLGYWVT